MTFFPKTKGGKRSIKLIVAFFIFLGIGNLMVAFGEQGGETFLDNLKISVPMSLAGICAIAAFCFGLVSIIKNKERSILVFLTSLIGLFILFFILGEFIFPH